MGENLGVQEGELPGLDGKGAGEVEGKGGRFCIEDQDGEGFDGVGLDVTVFPGVWILHGYNHDVYSENCF